MKPSLLKEIGLTETESKVYLCLLSIGATSAGRIVQETGVFRKNVYDTLQTLIEKGLVTYVVENKIKYFQPKSPENLLRFLEEKKSRINGQVIEIKNIIPELLQKFSSITPEIQSEIYRGTEGIKTILNECLNYKEILFIGATGEVENRLPYFWPKYNEKREKMKVMWKLLLVYEARHKAITKSKYYQYKVLPKIVSGLNVIYIYGDYMANVLWLEKPVAFVIKHKSLAESYRKYFHYLWNKV